MFWTLLMLKWEKDENKRTKRGRDWSIVLKSLPMTGFESRASGIRSNRSTNWARCPLRKLIVCLPILFSAWEPIAGHQLRQIFEFQLVTLNSARRNINHNHQFPPYLLGQEISVTRLGSFLIVLATKFLTKVAQIFGDFFGNFKEHPCWIKNCNGYFLGSFCKFLGYFSFLHLVTLCKSVLFGNPSWCWFHYLPAFMRNSQHSLFAFDWMTSETRWPIGLSSIRRLPLWLSWLKGWKWVMGSNPDLVKKGLLVCCHRHLR